MRVHSFNGPMPGQHNDVTHAVCQAITGPDRHKCEQGPGARIHQFIASTGCYNPAVTVEVFVGRSENPVDGIHFARVAWLREDDGSWYSAWFAPHNEPGTYHRADQFDCMSPSHLALVAADLLNDVFSKEDLLERGITNQYIKKSIKF